MVTLQAIDTGRLPVTYTENGKGRPLLLITGYGQTAEEWPPKMICSLAGGIPGHLYEQSQCLRHRG